MKKPVRLQLSRRKGFDLQARSLATNGLPAVNVARPGKWGNPNLVTTHGHEGAVRAFARDLRGGILNFSVEDVRRELRGKNLACWCKPGAPCHADVLLEIANGPICDEAGR
ncbi:DUF4326 domain-containing protein [Ensifer sp. LCM 4579]|uniref:DUF4326 domain-containing protein n=1 Tax=Ensifer sp. LCM 4579 TaxID=1848292 RepID=UPI0008D9538E|nr:DUF4326 domain-containing protein [Ensifer sp. LCM 4579]OHV85914.1 hypothetical protein LCM4579_00705 [Ensifer sp. LCM 4579]